MEIDLLFKWKRQLWAVEVKLTAHPSPGDMAALNKAADLVGAHRRLLVSQTSEPVLGQRESSSNLRHLLDLLREAIG